jgi:hypothetical protein
MGSMGMGSAAKSVEKSVEKSVAITAQRDAPKLSRGQKTFNGLVKEIEGRRAVLRAWEQTSISYQTKCVEELLPLERRFSQLQLKMVHSLDQAWDQKGLNKSEKRMISEMVTTLAGAMLDENSDQADLKAIYNKHSDGDFDTEAAAERDDMNAIAEMLFGTEAGEADATSSDDPIQHVYESRETEDDRPGEAAARAEARQAKKSPKQLAAEERARAEQADLGRSIREVYRKLVVALHPDREPDPQERERKTELMQRVNAAYSQKNLLQLLELQLELEHIDQGDINNISEDRLKHYNKILKEQLGELNAEIIDVEHSFRFRLDMEPFSRLTPDIVMHRLIGGAAELRRSIRELDKDLRVFADVRILKMWLDGFRRSRQRAYR